MKRSILISVFFLFASIFLCTDALADPKTQTLYQRLQPRSGTVDLLNDDGRYETSPSAAEVKRDRRAAERGDASAQFKMGLRYDLGIGVPQNYAKSVKWIRKAAEQDYASAQYNLGSMYFSGLGVSQDFVEAFQWFYKAAEQGNASALNNLGAMYGKGQGVPQNHSEAYIWLSIATMSGNKEAIRNRDFAASNLSPEELGLAQNRAKKLYQEIQQ